ncbi:MAG TPA: hypothetical protein VMT93_09360 [Gemmatimonadaceae bacterium]|nr:hypothetical protein [Gemmatimonadaceae bacterium]
MAVNAGPTAAIAGITPGVQGQGVWVGRRQLFVRFAGEAETAVLYTAEMLGKAVSRAVANSALHSIALAGRDPLASAALIAETFKRNAAALPLMLDCDGQRPDDVPPVTGVIGLLQVTFDFGDAPAIAERALQSLKHAAAAGKGHALVLTPRDATSDGQILRIVEQAHAAVPSVQLVIHPAPGAEKAPLDRRYATLMDQAMAIHRDVTLLMRVPSPVGVR